MFVDDDVLLAPDCVAQLLKELTSSPNLGAIAADYSPEKTEARRSGHVTMGATLFRREVFGHFRFRATDALCECWCACIDLRQSGFEIRFSQTANAYHLTDNGRQTSLQTATGRLAQDDNHRSSTQIQGIIFAAFDRRDIQRFEHQFMRTLRAHGNHEKVLAVVYGLYPSEINRLSTLFNVDIIPRVNNGQLPPIRRLWDFYELTQTLNPYQPVAYWDVSDVIFQDSLNELWFQVNQSRDRIHAVIEPKGYPDNQVIPAWSLSIHDPNWARTAFRLLQENPFLNSGFAAGTASALGRYFLHGHQFLNGPVLRGTTDWGDQMCLNMYCHLHPEKWNAANSRWNYCIHDRPEGEIYVDPHGRIHSQAGFRISVAHGNARSLRQFSLLHYDSQV